MPFDPMITPAAQLWHRDDWDDEGESGNSDCTTAVPGANGNVPIDACNSYYNYDPAFAPAVAVAAIFGILTALHIVEAVIFRKRHAWVLIMGGAWETAAFILHALGARDQQQIAYATAWQLLFLLAPLWVNAFAYMTFARLAWYFQPERAFGWIRPASVAKYFVWADVLTFIIQGVGGSMADPDADADAVQLGLNIYLAGVGCQQFFILVFLAGFMAVFHRRASRSSVLDGPGGDYKQEGNWKPLQFALYAVLGLITIRIIYRIVEFAGGVFPSNPIPFHEEYAYALDCFPMMLCLLILAIWHPGRYLVGPESEFPRKSRAEKKAEKLERRAAKRQRKEEKKARKRGVVAYEHVQQSNDSLEFNGQEYHRNDGYSNV